MLAQEEHAEMEIGGEGGGRERDFCSASSTNRNEDVSRSHRISIIISIIIRSSSSGGCGGSSSPRHHTLAFATVREFSFCQLRCSNRFRF